MDTPKRSDTTTQETTCTPPSPLPQDPIIDTILADVNAVVPNFSSLVSSYRLLVGAAEEISRIPNVCPDVFERAVRRFDNSGTLIDILLDLLCCKITFSSELLGITCAPVDLFRLFANRCTPCDQSHLTADQIITLEAARKILRDCLGNSYCFPDYPVICPTSPLKPPTAPTTPPPTVPSRSVPEAGTSTVSCKKSAIPPNQEEALDFESTIANDSHHQKQTTVDPSASISFNRPSHRLMSRINKKSTSKQETKTKNSISKHPI